MKIDFQLHSTYSDGYYTPTELAKFVNGQGIKVVSLTDHNTVSGLQEFQKACSGFKVKVITGLELYSKFDGRKLNLLWYNFDPSNPELHDLLRKSQIRRRQRVRKILENLIKRGYKMDINKILDKYTHYIPINHVIDEIISQSGNLNLLKKELKSSSPREEDMIKKLFFKKEVGILHESNIEAEKIFGLRKKIGGQIIYCHPAKYVMPKFEYFTKLKKAGLDGIELLSPHHTYGAIMQLQDFANKLNFITTGGSDFHRDEGQTCTIKNSSQYFNINSEMLRRIGEIIK